MAAARASATPGRVEEYVKKVLTVSEKCDIIHTEVKERGAKYGTY
jgi:hypothetical protein